MRILDKMVRGSVLSLLILTSVTSAFADPIPAPSGQAAINQFVELGKITPPSYKAQASANQAPMSPALSQKAALRSYIKDQRRKLYAHIKHTPTSQPRMSTKDINEMLTKLSEKRAGRASYAAPRSVNPNPRSVPSSFNFNSFELVFGPSDYNSGMNQLFYSYQGYSNERSVAVDFNYVDLKPQYDYVEIYDYTGLCAAYTGNISNFVSEVCAGPNLDIWIVTDSNSEGGTAYNGFKIDGFYTSTDSAPNTVPSDYPVATALADRYTLPVGQTVFFDGTQSYDPKDLAGTIWYQWNFGDGTSDPTVGTSSSEGAPSHVYNTPGTYTVTLSVTNQAGFTSTDQVYITVQQIPPTASFALKASPIYIANPAVIYPVDNNRADSLNVDWGDGSVQNFNPYVAPSTGFQHLYSAPGTYQITVTANNIAGQDIAYATIVVSNQQIPPVVELLNQGKLNAGQYKGYNASYNLEVGSDGQISSVDLNWGGPTPDTALQHLSSGDLSAFLLNGKYDFTVNHSYTSIVNGKKKAIAGVYDTTITATDQVGLQTTVDYRFATKNLPPVVSKAISGKCKGTTCTLGYLGNQAMEKLIYDKDGTIVDFYFELYQGDHTNLVLECPKAQDQRQFTCTFSEGGTYYLHLRATDNLGAHTDVWKTLRVKAPVTKIIPLSGNRDAVKPPAPPSENLEF